MPLPSLCQSESRIREIRIEKSSDADLLREMLQFVAGKLMELEVDGRPHSRTPSTFM